MRLASVWQADPVRTSCASRNAIDVDVDFCPLDASQVATTFQVLWSQRERESQRETETEIDIQVDR